MQLLAASFAISIMAVSAGIPAPILSKAEHDYGELQAYSRELDTPSTRTKSRLIRDRYLQLYATYRRSGALAATPLSEVEFIYRASTLAASYTHDDKIMHDAEAAYLILEAHGLARDRHRREMYDRYVEARQFGKAQALAKQFATLPQRTLPPPSEQYPSSTPTAWRMTDGGRPARIAVDARQPAQIIVIGHPNCGYSARAARDIAADRGLAPMLGDNAVWLLPQQDRFDFNELTRWQSAYPKMNAMIVHKQNEWRAIDHWDTPTFYFLKNGKVAYKVVGWPAGGRAAELERGLVSIGLNVKRQPGDKTTARAPSESAPFFTN